MIQKLIETLELEALQVDPQTQVFVVALAAPRVPTEPHWAQSWQHHQRADVQHRQVVPTHIQHLEGQVFREGVLVNYREPRVVGHPEHDQTGQRAKGPVLDVAQRVEGEVQVSQLPQVPKGGLGDLRQGVVAAVQVHQIGEVVERQRRQLHDPVVGDDQLPRGQRQVDRKGGQMLPGALNDKLLVTHAPVRAARGQHRGSVAARGEEEEERNQELQGLRAWLRGKTHDTSEGFIHPARRQSGALTSFIDQFLFSEMISQKVTPNARPRQPLEPNVSVHPVVGCGLSAYPPRTLGNHAPMLRQIPLLGSLLVKDGGILKWKRLGCPPAHWSQAGKQRVVLPAWLQKLDANEWRARWAARRRVGVLRADLGLWSEKERAKDHLAVEEEDKLNNVLMTWNPCHPCVPEVNASRCVRACVCGTKGTWHQRGASYHGTSDHARVWNSKLSQHTVTSLSVPRPPTPQDWDGMWWDKVILQRQQLFLFPLQCQHEPRVYSWLCV